MNSKYIETTVFENEKVEECVHRISIEGDFEAKPGQFYMVRAWDDEPVLSRPISINDIFGGKISFLFQVVGRGTKILASLKAGDPIKIMGPLGNGFDIEKAAGRVAMISGGMGIAPLNYFFRCAKGRDIDFYAGFRSNPYGMELVQSECKDVVIATEDSSCGESGYIIDHFNPSDYDVVFCCGPEKMMARLIKKCEAAGVPVYVSMEKKMACGIGACLVCTCKTKDGNKRSCTDGPVFLGSELIINDEC